VNVDGEDVSLPAMRLRMTDDRRSFDACGRGTMRFALYDQIPQQLALQTLEIFEWGLNFAKSARRLPLESGPVGLCSNMGAKVNLFGRNADPLG